MAKLSDKSLDNLNEWNTKELRKLRMTLHNRIEKLKKNPKDNTIKSNHPLYGLGPVECEQLMDRIKKTEKTLKIAD